jgi:serine/threonine-protein kinase BUR1
MKTANILVDNQGNLQIADFGLARPYHQKSDQVYTNCVVTRWYRPPELLLGETKYGPAIDIWGVGYVPSFFFLLSTIKCYVNF